MRTHSLKLPYSQLAGVDPPARSFLQLGLPPLRMCAQPGPARLTLVPSRNSGSGPCTCRITRFTMPSAWSCATRSAMMVARAAPPRAWLRGSAQSFPEVADWFRKAT